MSESAPEATATATTETEPKPVETVDFWKEKAREQEKRAKANAAAATQLAAIEESNKSEAQKAADRIAKAEAEVATIPAKVSEALRSHLVALGIVSKEDEVLLTASDPDTLLAQIKRLSERAADRKKSGNHVPTEGKTPAPASASALRDFTRGLFGGD